MPLPNQDATQVQTNNGLRTPYGIILPPGAKVAAYVRSTGIQNDGNDSFLSQNLVTTLAAGLVRARSGFGDFVVCLPGHAETVSDATTFSNALVAATKIVGVGRGSSMPTFSFDGAATTWAVNKADVLVSGVRLKQSGAAVATPVTVSAADFGFYNNEVIPAPGIVTSIVRLAAGSDRADISFNTARATLGTSGTPFVEIVAAVSDLRIANNELVYPAQATVGFISVQAAAVNMRILSNYLYNTTTNSTACITFGAFASDGFVDGNFCHGTNATGGATLISLGATTTVRLGGNFGSTTVRTTGVLTPTTASS